MCELISAFPGALIPDSWPLPSYLWEGEQGLEREDLSQPVMFVRHSLESFHEMQKNIKVMYADYEGIITSAHPTSLFAIYKSNLHVQACNFISQNSGHQMN